MFVEGRAYYISLFDLARRADTLIPQVNSVQPMADRRARTGAQRDEIEEIDDSNGSIESMLPTEGVLADVRNGLYEQGFQSLKKMLFV